MKVKKNGKKVSQRKEVVNESQKDEEGGERGEPKRQEEKESVRVGSEAFGWSKAG